jgi:hypothetical protein
MSGGFSVTVSALEIGSSAISSRAEDFGNVGASFAAGASSGSEFGTMSVSGQLSGLTSRLSAVHRGQFGAAQHFLSATADALDQAGKDYAKTDEAAATASKTILA